MLRSMVYIENGDEQGADRDAVSFCRASVDFQRCFQKQFLYLKLTYAVAKYV